MDATRKDSEKKFPFSLERLKTAWKNKTPYQKWKFFYKIGYMAGEIIEVRVFSKEMPGVVGYVPAVTCFIYYSLLLYTVYFYIQNDQFAQCLPSFCFVGFATSVSEKLNHKCFKRINEEFGLIVFCSHTQHIGRP